MIFAYETLKVIWWGTVGVILIVFALTDGWDLGIGMLSPFLGKSDLERRVILRAIEANWEGNQTWLVIAGGVLFAAWPLVYAASFSGMYLAMLLVLVRALLPPGGFQVSQQGGGSPLAHGVGLGPVHRRLRARARIRHHRLCQSATIEPRLAGERRRCGRGYPDRGFFDVPVRHAVVVGSEQQPHRLGFGIKLAHAADHVLGHRFLRATDCALHGLGV